MGGGWLNSVVRLKASLAGVGAEAVLDNKNQNKSLLFQNEDFSSIQSIEALYFQCCA